MDRPEFWISARDFVHQFAGAVLTPVVADDDLELASQLRSAQVLEPTLDERYDALAFVLGRCRQRELVDSQAHPATHSSNAAANSCRPSSNFTVGDQLSIRRAFEISASVSKASPLRCGPRT